MHMPEEVIQVETLECSIRESASEVAPNNTNPAATLFALELNRIKTCKPPTSQEIQRRWVFLGTQTKKSTLVLDLDETLVAARNLGPDDLPTSLEIAVRPSAQKLLVRLSATYEIVVFTAAEEEYAKQIVDYLDPEHKYVKLLLARPHCIPVSGGWLVKDLRIFADRDLTKMLIVDNSILSLSIIPPMP